MVSLKMESDALQSKFSYLEEEIAKLEEKKNKFRERAISNGIDQETWDKVVSNALQMQIESLKTEKADILKAIDSISSYCVLGA